MSFASTPAAAFDPACRACPRIAAYLQAIRSRHPSYHAAPVAPFGSCAARLLVVGLAPGMHGANRTGRPFTGDYAGVLLYATLHKFGFASQRGSDDPGDGLALAACRVTNAVKCVPPANRPEPGEVRRCNRFLAAEIETVSPRAVLALGRIAHQAVLMAMAQPPRAAPFAHGAERDIAGIRLFDSYHCSRYNTQTRRLSVEMFESVLARIAAFLG